MEDKITDSVEIENAEPERKEDTVNVKLTDHVKEKKRGKEEKGRKKDDKRAAEQYLKGLRDVHTTEQKLEAMCKKFSEIIDENRSMQVILKQAEKKIFMLLREKEQYQGERTKAVLTRKRLESLCRELQKQNKAVKEECLLKIREEEEKRKDVTTKFESTLAEITALMNQNIEKNTKMYEDNVEMNKKCKAVYEQMELREQHLRTVHQGMKSNLQRAYAELANVKKTALTEKQQLLFKLSEYQAQIRELQATEVGLRSQISLYTDKYDEFQNALNRSNKVYGEFNEEMERMSKKILTLEKETILWKQKWEKSHVALLEMAADKQAKDKELATLSKKVSLLQDLCKMFQRERTSLLAQLREKTGMSECEIIAQSGSQESSKPAKQTSETTTGIHPTAQGTFRAVQMIMAEVSEIVNKQFYTDASDQKDGAQDDTKKDTEESKVEDNKSSGSSDSGSKEESDSSKESIKQDSVEETKDTNQVVDEQIKSDAPETDGESGIAERFLGNDEIERIRDTESNLKSDFKCNTESGTESAAGKKEGEELEDKGLLENASSIECKDGDEKTNSSATMDASTVEAHAESLVDDIESAASQVKNGEMNADAEEMQRFRDAVLNGFESLGNAVKSAIEEQLEFTNSIEGKIIGESKEDDRLNDSGAEASNVKADSDNTEDLTDIETKLSETINECLSKLEVNSVPSVEAVNSNIEALAEATDDKLESELVETLLSAKGDVSTEGPTETRLPLIGSNDAEAKVNSPASAKNPKKKKK